MVAVNDLVQKLNAVSISAEITSSLHLEVRIKKGASKHEIEKLKELIASSVTSIEDLYNWRSFGLTHPDLKDIIDQVMIGCSNTPDGQKMVIESTNIPISNVHVYNVREGDALATSVETGDSESSVASHHWQLPCKEFDDIWENLIFDDNIKNDLLSFVYALLKLSDRGTNSNIIAVNRMILLHGPPGTGKTSLCKALAQRLTVRLSNRYKRSIFIEVNSHSLFSKWFAESGKLIMKLFEQIEECASDAHQLVFVLIDEVESLTIGRTSSYKGNDPSDALRSVNAVLTQMDKIRRLKNVLVLTTSNITEALDEAFVDRADVNRYVGHPSEYAIYGIWLTVIKELQRVDIIDQSIALSPVSSFPRFNEYSQKLLVLASHCRGISGRTIRKLPVLAYSRLSLDHLTMDQFLHNLEAVINEKIPAKLPGHNQTAYEDKTTSTIPEVPL
uniref:AAA+ ATPase domain-containing protein n=1 Tax=Panagrolaimus superbus TaxID=310955 RepID=A0A914Y1M6_9BILA